MKKRVIAMLMCLCLLLSGCGMMEGLSQAALDIELAQEDVYTLSDGTPVDLWVSKTNPESSVTYRAGDQSILRVDYPGSYAAFAANLSHWNTMDATAQDNVVRWFEDRGAQFHLDGLHAELVKGVIELAYADYLACQESGDEYVKWYEAESVSHVASNEQILVFETTVKGGEGWFAANVTLGTAMHIAGEAVTKDPVRTTQIFDTATGELIDIESIFTVSREEAEAELTRLYNESHPEQTVEHVYLEYVLPGGRALYIAIPQSVNGADELYYTPIGYEQVQDLLQPWALDLEGELW